MYKAKYYKTIESLGHQWQIIIWQDTDNEVTLTEIGPVLQGLRLSVQGEQADIETPIVKTSLTMVFVDAPDLDDTRKCGNWEEFYTSSATEYKVVLYKDNIKEWTGYITPDSFAEDLQYRGSVSIIARDNLGALQDAPYDLLAPSDSELVTLANIFRGAMQKIQFPMEYYIMLSGGGARGNLHTSEMSGYEVELSEVFFNNSAFINKSWKDVLEAVLSSTGVTLRYVGANKCVLTTMRDLPLYDKYYNGDVPVIDVRFSAYGHRELNPAVKSIREEVRFEIADSIVNPYTDERSFGEKDEYVYGVDTGEDDRYNMPAYIPIAGLFRVEEGYKTVLLNPYAYKLNAIHKYGKGGEIHNNNILYVCANAMGSQSNTRKVSFKRRIPAGQYKISFEVNKAVALYDNETTIGYYKPSEGWWDFGYEARFRGDDGSLLILNNRAGTTTKEPEWEDLGGMDSNGYHSVHGTGFPVMVESPVLEVSVAGEIEVRLMPARLEYNRPSSQTQSRGAYLGIAKFALNTIDNGGTSIMDVLRVNTEYNYKNNIIITRNPEFAGNISDLIYWGQVRNGIYVDTGSNYIGSEQWVFNIADNPAPLSVLIHQQILAYYSKPNNVLTGELVVGNPLFNALYRWKGKNHIITSGTLNILSGRMENVVLREFVPYAQIWSRTYVLKDVYNAKKDKSTILVSVYGDKEITTDSIGSPYWVAAVKVSRLGEAQLVTFTIEGNDTGVERIAEIEIDTAKIKVVQAAR